MAPPKGMRALPLPVNATDGATTLQRLIKTRGNATPCSRPILGMFVKNSATVCRATQGPSSPTLIKIATPKNG